MEHEPMAEAFYGCGSTTVDNIARQFVKTSKTHPVQEENIPTHAFSPTTTEMPAGEELENRVSYSTEHSDGKGDNNPLRSICNITSVSEGPRCTRAQASSTPFSEGGETSSLDVILKKWGMPDDSYWASVDAAFELLQTITTLGSTPNGTPGVTVNTLTPNRPLVVVLPHKTFAQRLNTLNDDIECLAVGSMSADIFMELIWDNIRNSTGSFRILEQSSTKQDSTIIEVNKVHTFAVKYLQSKDLLAAFPHITDATEMFLGSLPDDIGVPVLALQGHFKATALLQGSDNRLFYTFRAMSIVLGLWGQHMAAGEGILLQIYNDVETLVQRPNHSRSSLGRLFDMLTALLDTVSEHAEHNRAKTKQIETLVGVQTSGETYATHELECQRLAAILETASSLPILARFSHDYYVVVDVNYWGQTLMGVASMFDFIQKPFDRLVKGLGKISCAEVYRCPTRFATVVPVGNAQGSDYEGFLLIGLDIITSQDRGILKSKVDEFPTSEIWAQVDAFNNYLERTIAITKQSFSAIARSSVARTQDNRGRVLQPIPSPTAFQLDSAAFPELTKWPRVAVADPNPVAAEERQKLPNPDHRVVSPGLSLRPALEILKKLKNDPAYDVNDYEIGYNDLSYLNWKLAGTWTTETTADDFVPQSRIWYFRKTDGGSIIWDRNMKIDRLS